MNRLTRTLKKRDAWIEARVQHYIETRSIEGLARMLVDLENDTGAVPEFEIDEDWPTRGKFALTRAPSRVRSKGRRTRE